MAKAAEPLKIPKSPKGNTFSKSSQMPKYVIGSKPKNSPVVDKWLDKGGTITVNDGTWTYTNPQGVSVKYKNGYPDFKGSGHVKQEVDIGGFTNYSTDFRKANELTGGLKDPANSTWHHFEDGRTLQEVPQKIHKQFTHIGGMSLSK